MKHWIFPLILRFFPYCFPFWIISMSLFPLHTSLVKSEKASLGTFVSIGPFCNCPCSLLFILSLSLMNMHSGIIFIHSVNPLFCQGKRKDEFVSMRMWCWVKIQHRANRTGGNGDWRKAAGSTGELWRGQCSTEVMVNDGGPKQSKRDQNGQIRLRLAGSCCSRKKKWWKKKWQWLKRAQGKKAQG